jgi:hypothetical protein
MKMEYRLRVPRPEHTESSRSEQEDSIETLQVVLENSGLKEKINLIQNLSIYV